VNDTSTDILFESYRMSWSENHEYCLLKKPDTIHYKSKDDCFQVAEFRETKDSGVYSTVIPPNHVLYKGRRTFNFFVNWLIKDLATMEVIDDFNDRNNMTVYPKKLISFRRVFVYEVGDQEGGKEL
jgi:hypothetical protein